MGGSRSPSRTCQCRTLPLSGCSPPPTETRARDRFPLGSPSCLGLLSSAPLGADHKGGNRLYAMQLPAEAMISGLAMEKKDMAVNLSILGDDLPRRRSRGFRGGGTARHRILPGVLPFSPLSLPSVSQLSQAGGLARQTLHIPPSATLPSLQNPRRRPVACIQTACRRTAEDDHLRHPLHSSR